MGRSTAQVRYFFEFLAEQSRGAKRAIMATVDAVLLVASIWLAFYLRLGTWDLATEPMVRFSVFAFIIGAATLWLCGVYKAIFRFVGAGMMSILFRALLIYTAIMLVVFGFIGVPGVPRTVSFIQPLVFFALVVGFRTVLGFVLLEVLGNKISLSPTQTALIYGAGHTGQQLVRALHTDRTVQIAGYLDDDSRLDGQKLDGKRIYSAARLDDVLAKTGANVVLLAVPGLARARRREIIERLSRSSVEVRAMPSMGEMVGGKVSFDEIRPIELEDLLGRDSVAPNELLMARTLLDKTVLVTGAGGSIGSELCRQIVKRNPRRLVLAEMTESALFAIDTELRNCRDSMGRQFDIIPELVNVSNRDAVNRLFANYRPDTVFHAAAYKHVPLVEANVLSGLHNNIVGTMACAEAALAHGTSHLILVSTDKAVRPTNVMGASKRVCELILQGLSATTGKTRFASVRFGNVLGSSGSVVPHFLEQIRRGGPVTLTHRDITRFFMTIPEAAQLVIQAGGMAEGGEVYLLDMGQPVRIYDLAATMIRLSGLEVKDASNPDGDIEILEVGLRPGEKLFEELLIDCDAERTNHPRVMRGRERMIPMSELRQQIAAMEEGVVAGNRDTALCALAALVPEYQPTDRELPRRAHALRQPDA